MANFVIWMDQDHAKIFELHPNKIEAHNMKRHEIRHHSGFEKEQNNHKNGENFFHLIAKSLSDAHQILLLGPGLAKAHFKAHLDQHHHSDLAKKVVAVETVDHPTDPEIVASAKKYFRTHLRFE